MRCLFRQPWHLVATTFCVAIGKGGARTTTVITKPRYFSQFNKNNNNNNNSDIKSSNRWFQAATVLLGLVVAEEVYYYYEDYKLKNDFESTINMMQQDANEYSRRRSSNQTTTDTKDMPTLFMCKVVETHPSLDGTLMLKNVQVGDKVHVLTAEIGPDQAYHLCRLAVDHEDSSSSSIASSSSTTSIDQASTKQEAQVGWFPREFLQEIES